MLFARSFLLTIALTLITSLPLTTASFSFNSAFASNGITVTNRSFNGTIPSGTLSTACAAAYSASVNCSMSLVFVGPKSVNFTTTSSSTTIPLSAFEGLYHDVCTESCYSSLQQWREKLASACDADFDNLFNAMSGNGYSDPETYLANYGLPVAGAGPNVYQFGSAYRYTEKQWLNWIFWGKCLRDLDSTAYCTLTELKDELAIWPSTEASRYSHISKDEAIARNQTFCQQATCFMQSEMIKVAATYMFEGKNTTPTNITDRIANVCPGINATASFPFLQIGVMYPFDDANNKITADSVPSNSHEADGIVDLSGVNSTETLSSAMSLPVSGITLHLGCFVLVVGVTLLF